VRSPLQELVRPLYLSGAAHVMGERPDPDTEWGTIDLSE
jgi:hypothetical protein